MSDIVDLSPNRPLDRDGLTVPGALAYFYLSGTTTPQEVYTTAAGDVAHPIPLEADAEGVFPPIFSAVALKCTVTDASGNVLPGYPVDPVAIIPTGSGASSITFEPTADIPETNVQSAIERVQLNLVEPLLAGGIGVTGNADTLANIDATNTASGAYRFTTGATGTFPSGVTASDGGTIRLWRETAAEAVMELVERGTNVTWVRSLTGGAWGAWVSVPSLSGLGVTATAADINKIAGLATNAPGAPPIFGVRAWANINGQASTVRASGNVFGFTRTGIGFYTVSFVTPMTDANYAITFGLSAGPYGTAAESARITSQTSSQFSVQCDTTNSGADQPYDPTTFCFAVYR